MTTTNTTIDTPVAPVIDIAALGKVAVLQGGTSAERPISLLSGAGVLEALRSRGVDAHAFDPAERDLAELRREGFARCFIALHGRHGEDGTVQGALELLGIPYTGSGVMASSVALDKVMTKRIWLADGLPTPRYVRLAADRALMPALQDRFVAEADAAVVGNPFTTTTLDASHLGVQLRPDPLVEVLTQLL